MKPVCVFCKYLSAVFLTIIFLFFPHYIHSQQIVSDEIYDISAINIKNEISGIDKSPNGFIWNPKIKDILKKNKIDEYIILGVFDDNSKWDFGRTINGNGSITPTLINVCFYLSPGQLKNIDNIKRLKSIKQYAEEWTKYGNIKFNFNFETPCTLAKNNSQIKISGDHPSGYYWSLIGSRGSKNDTTLNMPNFLNVSDDIKFRRKVIHEFGHALGLLHEQQNKEIKCEIDIESIIAQTGKSREFVEKNYKIFEKDYIIDSSNYDSLSIMHYPMQPWYFKNGCKIKIAENNEISEGDANMIRKKYPKFQDTAITGLKKEKESLDKLLKLIQPLINDDPSLSTLQSTLAERSFFYNEQLKNPEIKIDKSSLNKMRN